MKIQPLPPLTSLIAFEATARHLSFTAAARELSVTQGAVSRQIRLLEDYLGENLFERSTREVNLTATGSRYYETVHASLGQIAKATGEIRHWQGARQITVMTSSAMASLWLLPKVAEFQKANEDIDLRIVVQDYAKEHQWLDCDLALYYCRTPPRNMQATPLFCEEVFPVCSPAYLQRHPQIGNMQHLSAATWLWLDDSHRDWISWFDWYEQSGFAPQEPRQRVNINNYSMLIQSALNGQGIALAWSNLVSDHLQTGALVRPVDNILRTAAQFFLLEPPIQTSNRQVVSRFRKWLMQQVDYKNSSMTDFK